ncbi:MAG: GNAT family N-acetyltransferase [Burkholderiales bacterium]|nr:GNAT family N-acetyltransferase [Burkholderiales bacterium]
MTEMPAHAMLSPLFSATALTVDAARSGPIVAVLQAGLREDFREYLQPTSEQLIAWRQHLLLQRIEQGETVLQWLNEAGEVVAVSCWAVLDWDTRQFGMPVVRIGPVYCRPGSASIALFDAIYQGFHAFGIQHQAKLFQRRMVAGRWDETASLAKWGYRLVDSFATLLALPHGGAAQALANGLSTRTLDAQDADAMRQLASGAFAHSRFEHDTAFPAGSANAVYLGMLGGLLKQLNVGAADLLAYGVCDAGHLVGFIFVRIIDANAMTDQAALATVEMIAVHPAYGGRGIGRSLLAQVSDLLAATGVSRFETSTWLDHAGSMAMNQAAGFRVKENLLTWLRDAP